MLKLYNLKSKPIATLILLLLSFVSYGQVNIAPLATASAAPACNTGACSTLNDLNFGTCGSQQMWITSAATNPGSSVNITFIWSTPQAFNKFTIHNGEQNNRFLGGGTLQQWNGTAWVTFGTFTQTNMAVCSYDINFNPVITTQVRIIDIVVTGTQSSNVNFREIQIWQANLASNDAGVISIDAPGQFCTPGSLPVVATIKNFGINQITSVNVNWSVNGTTQTPTTYTTLLDTVNGAGSNTASIALGTYSFPATSVALKVWTSSPNSVLDTVRMNDTLLVNKAPSMGGTFTIDSAGSGGSNFVSFAAAITAMQTYGLCGPVVFNVAAGTYTFTTALVIPAIFGASNVNSITFEGTNSLTRILTGNLANSAVVVMNAARYITFRNFTVTNTSTTAAGIGILGTCNRINVTKCIVNVPVQTGTSSTGYGIAITGSANGYGVAAQSSDSIVIDSNVVNGGGTAFVCYGATNAAANRGIKIRYNVTNSTNYMGGYIAYNYNPMDIIGNTINMVAQNYGYYGLYFYSNQSSHTTIPHNFYGNKILNFGYYGVYMYYPVATATAAPIKCYNNTISGGNGGSYYGYYGIYLALPAGARGEFYHNTIVMNGTAQTATTATCFYNTGSSAIILKNNVFAVTAGAYTPVYLATNPTGNVVNYNNYYKYVSPATSNLIYRGTNYTPATYHTATAGGDSSYNDLPSFVSYLPSLTANYHLTDGCNGYGVDLTASVPTDQDGITRSVTPNPGAYEFLGGLSNNLFASRLLTPAVPISLGYQDMKFIVKNIGNNSVTSFNASYKHNGNAVVTQMWFGLMDPCMQDTVTFGSGNQINVVAINTLKVYTDAPNANPDADKNNDTIFTTLYAPLNGTYTVGGTAPNFATPQLAAAALQYGVGGPVVFDIRPGTYVGQVIVPGPIIGSSSTNTITFEGTNAATRIITANLAGDGVFKILQASNVKVRNLTITNSHTGGTHCGFASVGTGSSYNASNNSIVGCTINLEVETSTSIYGYGISFTSTATGCGVAAIGSDSSVIDSNTINGGGYAIIHYGSTNSSYNRGVKIRNNTVTAANYMGGYIAYNYNAMEILNNSFTMTNQYGVYGLYFYSNQNPSTTIPNRIIGNTMRNFSNYGMYCYYPQGSAVAPTEIYNNMLSSGNTYNSAYGIYLGQPASGYTNVYHNTVVMNYPATSTSYTCLYNTGSSNSYIKNNIFGVTAGQATPVYLATNVTGNIINYNTYYNKAGTSLIYRNAVTYTAANYLSATAGGDTSYNVIPPYVSVGTSNFNTANYHINSACFQRGVDLSLWVPNDIDNQVRAVPGHLGADEATSGTLDLSVEAILAPTFPIAAGAQDIRIFVRNNGATAITSFNMAYRVNGGTPVTTSWTGYLLACDTATVTFTGTQQITIANNINYNFKVYSYNPNFTTDLNPGNDTIVTTLATPMSGNYIIGNLPTDNFATFGGAIAGVQLRGIGGPITFNVRTGTYVESFTVPLLTGSSATNTVTFQSMANHPDSVQVVPPTTNAFIVSLSGASNTIFRKISFISNSVSSAQNGFNIVGACMNDTIIDCKILMAIQTSYGNYMVYGTGLSNLTDGIALMNNTLVGSYYGIYFYGVTNTYVGRFRNVSLIGNTMTNNYAYTLYTYYSSGVTVSNNTFTPSSLYSGNITYFIYSDSLTFTGNRWNLTNNVTMYLGYYSGGSTGRRNLIANNMITGSLSMTSPTIYLGYYCNYMDIVHNSINVPGSSYAAYIYNTGQTNVQVKNNVFANTSTGSAAYYSALPTLTTTDVDYNVYYTLGTNFITGASTQSTIAGWRTACNCDKNSLRANPGFTSQTNLMPNPVDVNSWNLNGRANHYSLITTAPNTLPVLASDINNVARPINVAAGVSDIGAFEFTPTSTPVACTAVPTTPTAGGTQVFLVSGDTAATITWDGFTTPPSSITVRQYPGTKSPGIGTATGYANFYLNVTVPAGSYLYNTKTYYKPSWIGTVPSESVLRMAYKDPSTSWLVLTGTNSTVDSVFKNVATGISLTNPTGYFTLTDDNNPLPVSLIKFAGSKVDLSADLYWATASEKNSSYFVVERSFDHNKFEAVSKVKAKGNSSTLVNYTAVDPTAFVSGAEMVYYRLKMVDMDGSYTYSTQIVIGNKESQTKDVVNVYPNPFNDKVYVDLKLEKNQLVELRDISGRLVYSQVFTATDFTHELSLPQDLNKGIYFLSMGSNQISKLLKQ